MMWSFTLLLANFAFSVISTQETCDKDSCQSYFSDVEWSGTIQDLDKWLENQKSRKTVTFCNADSKIAANSKNLRQFSPISEPFQCPEIGSLVDFQGNLKNNLPHGKGRFHVLKLPKKQPPNSNCYELLNIIGSLHGKFQNGKLNGRGEIVYEDDETILEGNFFKGILNGKVRLFTNQDWLLFVGQFEAGLPHGPFWIFSRFYNQFIFMHFEHGKIFEEEVILYSPEEKKLLKGKMVENSFLKDAKEVKISKIGQYNCLQVIKTEEIEGHQTKQEDLIRLPVKIFSSIKDQRILIRPGKLLYYNRVAKTGSQSFTRLLFEMGKKHGYLMKVHRVIYYS